MVSLEPAPDVDAAIARLTPATNPEAERSARAAAPGKFRGVTQVVPRPQPVLTGAEAPWHRNVKPLANGPETLEGLAVRQFTVDNPPARP